MDGRPRSNGRISRYSSSARAVNPAVMWSSLASRRTRTAMQKHENDKEDIMDDEDTRGDENVGEIRRGPPRSEERKDERQGKEGKEGENRKEGNERHDERPHLSEEVTVDARIDTAAVQGATFPMLKGRAVTESIIVKHQRTISQELVQFYMLVIRLPPLQFAFVLFSVPVVLCVLFFPLYLLDQSGLQSTSAPIRRPFWLAHCQNSICDQAVSSLFFSLSISTCFLAGPVQPVSRYSILLSNVHTIFAQLMFVFASGAVFQRLSQPSSPVRWSQKAIICDDPLHDPKKDPNPPSKAFITRFVLTGPEPCELYDAKFQLVLRRHLRKEDNGVAFVMHTTLRLVRESASQLKYGMTLRHVIDDESPLASVWDEESLQQWDASFDVSCFGMENATLQPTFSRFTYFVSDGDVCWDRQYVDVFTRDIPTQKVIIDNTKLSLLKPLPWEKAEEEARKEEAIKK